MSFVRIVCLSLSVVPSLSVAEMFKTTSFPLGLGIRLYFPVEFLFLVKLSCPLGVILISLSGTPGKATEIGFEIPLYTTFILSADTMAAFGLLTTEYEDLKVIGFSSPS